MRYVRYFKAALTVAYVLSFPLYVLSIGPAYRLAVEGVISEEAFGKVYTDLVFEADDYNAGRAFVNWYTDLWCWRCDVGRISLCHITEWQAGRNVESYHDIRAAKNKR
jgi:hypothetical protein